MHKKSGIICMILGLSLLLGSISLLVYNKNADNNAKNSAMQVLLSIQSAIEKNSNKDNIADSLINHVDPFDDEAVAQSNEMTVTQIDGYGYIGYLSIPALGLTLPVMDTWDYTRLKISPCRQFGTAKGNDLVIAAHNYISHFGRIDELKTGDLIRFTDMDGNIYHYAVGAIEILSPTAVDEMKNSGWDLSLYTCTYRGANRITVRCDKTIN